MLCPLILYLCLSTLYHHYFYSYHNTACTHNNIITALLIIWVHFWISYSYLVCPCILLCKTFHKKLKKIKKLKLARCLQACWPFVGRYLGLSEEIITVIVQQVHQTTCTDKAFEMKTWRMMKGKKATFGRVHTAIQRLWEHDSMRSNCHNAYHCVTRCLQYYHYLHKQAAQ